MGETSLLLADHSADPIVKSAKSTQVIIDGPPPPEMRSCADATSDSIMASSIT